MKEPKNWFEYQAARVLPKPAYLRPLPAKERAAQPIEVEESFMDTIRMKAWKAIGR